MDFYEQYLSGVAKLVAAIDVKFHDYTHSDDEKGKLLWRRTALLQYQEDADIARKALELLAPYRKGGIYSELGSVTQPILQALDEVEQTIPQIEQALKIAKQGLQADFPNYSRFSYLLVTSVWSIIEQKMLDKETCALLERADDNIGDTRKITVSYISDFFSKMFNSTHELLLLQGNRVSYPNYRKSSPLEIDAIDDVASPDYIRHIPNLHLGQPPDYPSEYIKNLTDIVIQQEPALDKTTVQERLQTIYDQTVGPYLPHQRRMELVNHLESRLAELRKQELPGHDRQT